MNEKELLLQIMELRYHVVNYDRHVNGVYVHGDDFKHFLVKAAVFKVLSEAGHEVVTEAEFKDGTIADVLDATTGIIYEAQTDVSSDKVSPYKNKDCVSDVIVIPVKEMPEKISELKERIQLEVVT